MERVKNQRFIRNQEIHTLVEKFTVKTVGNGRFHHEMPKVVP
jgi:hypothetical protein